MTCEDTQCVQCPFCDSQVLLTKTNRVCSECHRRIRMAWERCPHCGEKVTLTTNEADEPILMPSYEYGRTSRQRALAVAAIILTVFAAVLIVVACLLVVDVDRPVAIGTMGFTLACVAVGCWVMAAPKGLPGDNW